MDSSILTCLHVGYLVSFLGVAWISDKYLCGPLQPRVSCTICAINCADFYLS